MSDETSALSKYDPRRAVASLVAGDVDGSPREYQDADDGTDGRTSRGWSTIRSARDVEIERPKDETSEYYRLYETNPFIGTPIDDVASEVWEPGWYIEADSNETVEELTEFCSNIGYVGNRPKRDLVAVGKQGVVQYLARGDWLCEKMDDDKERHVGLNPLQKETFEIYTDPGTNVVLAPDDTHFDHVKLTPRGDAAAYVQFDKRSERAWGDNEERRFTRDEIFHWANSPDVGDVWGTSTIERVYERALALEAKLRDNDDAVAMKAWPMVLFQTGTPEQPWTQDEIDDFMEEYEGENFGPGMYQAVPGDIDTIEFAGETADIKDTVTTDVDIILSGMPTPKYVLGTFENELSPSIASAQERKYRKYIRELRADLEAKLTSYLEEVCEDWGLDDSGLQLNIERPVGEVRPEDVNGNIIRYTSDVDSKGQAAADEADDPGGINDTDGEAPTDPSSDSSDVVPNMTDLAQLSSPVDDPLEGQDPGVEELSDSRLVGTRDLESQLTEVIAGVFTQARDDLLDRAQQRRNPADGQELREMARQALGGAADRSGLQLTASDTFDGAVTRTESTLQQANHAPTIQMDGNRAARLKRDAYQTLREDMDDVAVDLARAVRRTQSGDRLDEQGAEGVRSAFSDEQLEQRASVQSRMRTKSLVNELKLAEYEAHDEVVGVGITNPCNESTTLLCKQLAGCGERDRATAMFDLNTPVMDQLQSDVDEDPADGFEMTPVPPLHFGCRSELVPIVAD